VNSVWAISGAVVVAMIGFWLALRQDEVRWSREKRSELYIDLLAEALAEKEALLDRMTEAEMRASGETDGGDGQATVDDWRSRSVPLSDTRLDAKARALLGARMAAYASTDVIRLFNSIGAGIPLLVNSNAEARGHKVRAELAFLALERHIRTELMSVQRPWRQRIRDRLTESKPAK
jgi:hypothetical protein